MESTIAVMDAAPTKAGTVGNDVLTVHTLITEYDSEGAPYLRTDCGAGADEPERPTEWLRRVNCPDCLADDAN
ncbi:hypothetical protein ACFV97_21745 [Streptomyces sp. NPDC059913]|uniref:hypothetical protein n=1 Tax=unclassified Streptomyces TaxID=2593676 RepID=UPI0036640AC2